MSLVVLAAILTFVNPGQAKPEGYGAEPKSGHGPGVLVLHPWWGLNADVKAFCDRLAHAGFVAYAPDLFHGKTATSRPEAEALVKVYESRRRELQAQIDAAADSLDARTGKRGIAVVGFSFGASYALQVSNADPGHVRAVVVYYGTGQEAFGESKASYLGHFAEKDEFEPKADVDGLAKLLRDAGRPATFYTYPGVGHGFVEPSVKAAYDKTAAELAWRRTLAFLKKSLAATKS